MTNHELINRIAAERPEPPAGFEARQDSLLRGLTKKGGRKMKRKISAALSAALVLMALLTAAAAAEISGIDLFSFLKDNRHQDVLEQAQEAVLRFEALSHSFPDKAEVTVTEALYDGQFVMTYFRVRPLRDNLLIIPEGSEEKDIRVFFPDAESETIRSYAQRHGMDLLAFQPSMRMVQADTEYLIALGKSADAVEVSLNEDGTFNFLVLGSWYTPFEKDLPEMFPGGVLPVQLTVCLIPCQQDMDREMVWDTSLNLPYQSFTWWSGATLRLELPQYGIRLEGVAFHGFLVSSKLDILWMITDQAVYQQLKDGLRFDALDGEGNRLESTFKTGFERIIPMGKVYVSQVLSLPPSEASPETLTLRLYNDQTDETYEILEIPLQLLEIPEAMANLSLGGDSARKN